MATLGLAAALSIPGAVVAADDVTPPSGTVTIGNGSGYASTLTVTLSVPATDDVGVERLRIFQNGVLAHEGPYVTTLPWTFPQAGSWQIDVDWRDAAGNGFTAQAGVVIDTTPPTVDFLRFQADDDAADAVLSATIGNANDDGSPITAVRFRTGSGSWGTPIPAPEGNPKVVAWPMLDPAFGGSPVLGSRTVSVQVQNAAGLWSAATSVSAFIGLGDIGFDVTGDLRTGHSVTLAPDVPASVAYPSGTTCWWELYWGNDRSLYEGERDDTFGGITISGPPSQGYCDPWTVTIPWVPYRQFMVHFSAEKNGEPLVDTWLGSFPGDPTALRPGVDSTSRHISSSSLPMVYVLPDVYQLTVGVPATYRAYARAGAQILSTDLWTVAYTDHPEIKYGGSVFTFTPKVPGHITVCWGGGASRTYSISACYDPPARYPDRSAPNTSVPAVTIGGARQAAGVPVRIAWTGTDIGWGIDRYVLQRSVDGGVWTTMALPSARTTSIVQHLATGHSYRYRVRAVDKAGLLGAWDEGASFKPYLYEESRSNLVWYRSWASESDATASGGGLRRTSVSGATATIRFTGRAVAWLAEKGPGRGQVDVYLDGVRVATVDLVASSDSPRLVVFSRRFTTVGTHTMVLRNRATFGRREANVDAILLMR
jgi:hypothetical protein